MGTRVANPEVGIHCNALHTKCLQYGVVEECIDAGIVANQEAPSVRASKPLMPWQTFVA